MNNITERLEQEIAATMAEIRQATERTDVGAIQKLTSRALEFKSMREQLAAIERRFHALTGPKTEISPNPFPDLDNGAIRQLQVEVTQGMISQNLLTLTEHIKRGAIRIGEKLRVEAFPSGDSFETEVLASGNKLQERGSIGKFYRDAGVQPGNTVVLSEITPGQWQLKKRLPPWGIAER